jgi:hypothetical protein
VDTRDFDAQRSAVYGGTISTFAEERSAYGVLVGREENPNRSPLRRRTGCRLSDL